jgi:hypothetical protein
MQGSVNKLLKHEPFHNKYNAVLFFETVELFQVPELQFNNVSMPKPDSPIFKITLTRLIVQ